LDESDPRLHYAGQHSRHGSPHASKNQKTRSSAYDLWDEEPGRSPRTHGGDPLGKKGASREHS